MSSSWPSRKQLSQQYLPKDIAQFYDIKHLLHRNKFGLLLLQREPGQLTNEHRIILPASLIEQVLTQVHLLSMIHCGLKQTILHLQTYYYFARMDTITRYFLSTCPRCFLSRKIQPKSNSGNVPELIPHISTTPQIQFNTKLFVDLSGKLPPDQFGHRYFALYLDHCTQYVSFSLLKSKEAEEVTQAISKDWILKFGPPHTIQTDPGSEFQAKVFQQACADMNITLHFSPTNSPRSELAEIGMKRVKLILRSLLPLHNHEKWSSQLGIAVFTINNAISTSTLLAPSELVLRSTSPVSPNFLCPLPDEIATPGLTTFRQALNQAATLITISDRKQANFANSSQNYNKNKHPLYPLSATHLGQHVWFYKPTKITKSQSKSLTSTWKGPYIILKILSNITCMIALAPTSMLTIQTPKAPLHRCTIDRIYPVTPSQQHEDAKHFLQPVLTPQDPTQPETTTTSADLSDRFIMDDDAASDDDADSKTETPAGISELYTTYNFEPNTPGLVQLDYASILIALNRQEDLYAIYAKDSQIPYHLLLHQIFPVDHYPAKTRTEVSKLQSALHTEHTQMSTTATPIHDPNNSTWPSTPSDPSGHTSKAPPGGDLLDHQHCKTNRSASPPAVGSYFTAYPTSKVQNISTNSPTVDQDHRSAPNYQGGTNHSASPPEVRSHNSPLTNSVGHSISTDSPHDTITTDPVGQEHQHTKIIPTPVQPEINAEDQTQADFTISGPPSPNLSGPGRANSDLSPSHSPLNDIPMKDSVHTSPCMSSQAGNSTSQTQISPPAQQNVLKKFLSKIHLHKSDSTWKIKKNSNLATDQAPSPDHPDLTLDPPTPLLLGPQPPAPLSSSSSTNKQTNKPSPVPRSLFNLSTSRQMKLDTLKPQPSYPLRSRMKK